MNGYLVVVFVKFTADEAGRPPHESPSVQRFLVRLCATAEEANALNDKDLFEEVRCNEGFPFWRVESRLGDGV